MHGFAFAETAEHYTNGTSFRDRDFASDLQQMNAAFEALNLITTDRPELILAHEMLGEVAFVFASIF